MITAARRCFAVLALGAALQTLGAAPAVGFHSHGETYTGTHAGGGPVTLTVPPDGSGISSFSAGNPGLWTGRPGLPNGTNCPQDLSIGFTPPLRLSPDGDTGPSDWGPQTGHPFSNDPFGGSNGASVAPPGGYQYAQALLEGVFLSSPAHFFSGASPESPWGAGAPWSLAGVRGRFTYSLQAPNPSDPNCYTALTWAAIEAWPPATPACYRANKALDALTEKVRRLQKAVKRADTPRAEERAQRRLSKHRKKWRRAVRKRNRICPFGLG